jgi:hypothetical protein
VERLCQDAKRLATVREMGRAKGCMHGCSHERSTHMQAAGLRASAWASLCTLQGRGSLRALGLAGGHPMDSLELEGQRMAGVSRRRGDNVDTRHCPLQVPHRSGTISGHIRRLARQQLAAHSRVHPNKHWLVRSLPFFILFCRDQSQQDGDWYPELCSPDQSAATDTGIALGEEQLFLKGHLVHAVSTTNTGACNVLQTWLVQ